MSGLRMRIRSPQRPMLAVAVLCLGLTSSIGSSAEETRKQTGVLVSSGQPQPASSASPAAPRNTLRLRFVPKNPPPANSTSTVVAASTTTADTTPDPTPLPPKDPYALAHSRQEHPLSVDVENASPVKQVVGSPKTIDYSRARAGYVLDPGQPAAGSGTVRARLRTTSES